jgi:hypothetical protein
MGNSVRNHQSKVAVAGTVLLLALLAAVLLASNKTGSASASTPESVFAVLEHGSPAKSEINSPVGLKGDLDRGRLAVKTDSGAKVLVLPDGNNVCAITSQNAMIDAEACGTIDEGLSGDIVGVTGCLAGLPNGVARFYGIAPNDVDKVTYSVSGKSKTADSADNAFTFDSSEIPDSISFTTAGGKTLKASVPQVPGGLIKNCATPEDAAMDKTAK